VCVVIINAQELKTFGVGLSNQRVYHYEVLHQSLSKKKDFDVF
jgi:hypothetical protein